MERKNWNPKILTVVLLTMLMVGAMWGTIIRIAAPVEAADIGSSGTSGYKADIGSSGTSGYNGTDYAIEDHKTTTSTITISANYAKIKHVSVYVDIRHTYIGDLKVWVIDPNGHSCLIWNRAGSYHDNIIRDFSISAFNNYYPGGTWTLKVHDYAGGDTGYISYWSIAISLGNGGSANYGMNKVEHAADDAGTGYQAVSPDAFYKDSQHHAEVKIEDHSWAVAYIHNYCVNDDTYITEIRSEIIIDHSYWADLEIYLCHYDESSGYWVGWKLWDHNSTSGMRMLTVRITDLDDPSYAHKPTMWAVFIHDCYSGDTGKIISFALGLKGYMKQDTSAIKTALNQYQLVDKVLTILNDIEGYVSRYAASHSGSAAGKLASGLKTFLEKTHLAPTGTHLKDAIYTIIANTFKVTPTETMTEEEIRDVLKAALKTAYWAPAVSMLVTAVISTALADLDGTITTEEMKDIVANVIDAGVADLLEPVWGAGYFYDAWVTVAGLSSISSDWTLGHLIVDYIW